MSQELWRRMIENFVEGRIDGSSFEAAFLDAHRSEVQRGSSQPYAVELLLYEVDAYCADPDIRGPEDLDEEQLREQARLALSRWEKPWPPLP